MYKISIVIPVYNVENYIIECLQSILCQSFDDFEIIIVNDGSTDKSMEIVNHFIKGIEHISVINSVNEGLSMARNRGMNAAQGDYIYFCDADDYIEKDTLKTCYETLVMTNADVLVFGANIFGITEGKDKNQYDFIEKIGLKNGTVCEGIDFYKRHYLKFALVNTPMMMFKKRYLLENNLFYERGLLHEDFDFYNRMISQNPKIVILANRFYNRRYREGSIMSNRIQYKNIESYIEILNRLISCTVESLTEEFEYISIRQLVYILSMVDGQEIKLRTNDIKKIKNILNSYHIQDCKKNIKELLSIVLIQEEYCKKLGIKFKINGLKEELQSKLDALYRELNNNEESKIIIYGLGKWTLAYQKAIEMIYNVLESKFIYIDSFMKTGIDNRGRNLINVEDVNWSKIDTILVISEKREDEIMRELSKRAFHGNAIGLFSYYDEK